VTPNVDSSGSTVVFGAKWAGADAEWQGWDPPLPGAYGIHAMGIYKLAGGVVTRLSAAPGSCHETPGTPCAMFEEDPTIGPDGNIVDEYNLYLEQHSCEGCTWYVDGAYHTLSHPPRAEQDASGNETLDKPSPSDVPTPCAGADPDVNPKWPQLSPDGSLLAYTDCVIQSGPNTGDYSLVVANADGSNATACGIDDAKIGMPSWSLDGSHLIDSENGDSPGLWIYDHAAGGGCTGSAVEALSTPSGWGFNSPRFIGGGRIAFVAMPLDDTTKGEVYTISDTCGQGGSPCQFPTDAHQVTTGGRIFNLAWTSQTLTAVTVGGGGTGGGTGGGGNGAGNGAGPGSNHNSNPNPSHKLQASVARISARRLKSLLASGLPVTVSCSARCRVSAAIMLKRKTLGRAVRTLKQGHKLRLTIYIARRSRAQLRHARKLTLKLVIVDAAGHGHTLTRTFKLRR
ncbi:MAG: TolB family protein, partial [Solirubrobacteraceae bacterium]